jgi:hypothetical protein
LLLTKGAWNNLEWWFSLRPAFSATAKVETIVLRDNMRAEAELQRLPVCGGGLNELSADRISCLFSDGFVCATKKSGVCAEWAFLSAISTAGTNTGIHSNGWEDFPSRISQIAPQADRSTCSARMAAMCIDLALCAATVTGIQVAAPCYGAAKKLLSLCAVACIFSLVRPRN